MQPDLLNALIQNWPDTLSGHSHLDVALSGGLDSMVLLDLLCRWRDEQGGPQISATHVHHGISQQADAWLAHCQQQCALRGVVLRGERVQLQRQGGESLEAVAREARYAALARSPQPVLVLAHHADDQSETALLQLLRGGGVRALAAMPVLRQWQGKWLWRPLLACSRAQLAAYARQHALLWVEDDSNVDAANYLRNYLRLHTLPALRQRVSGLDARLARSAGQMADAASVLEEMAAQDAAQCLSGNILQLPGWRALSPARQRLLLLHWLGLLGWSSPAPAAMLAFQQAVLAGEAARLQLPQGQLVCYRQQLMAVAWSDAPLVWPLACQPGKPLVTPLGRLDWLWKDGGLSAACAEQAIWLTARKGGETLPQKVGRVALKKLFQTHAVPAALRDAWPLLSHADGTLLAVPGLGISTGYQAQGEGWWPLWQPTAVPRPSSG
jgi:tRNA(Ile)-lysidine synthase